jgi:hypothetical protein
MKKFSLLGATVAALCANAAYALPPLDDSVPANYAVRLVVSGSSAFKAAFENELSRVGSSVCAAGTFNKYIAAVTAGAVPDINAYSCTAIAGLLSGGGGEAMIIYYRAEGGSVFGTTPVVRPAAAVLRLKVDPTCGATSCPVGTYNPVADTVTGTNAVNASSDLGLADEEPSQFVAPNYPDAATSTKIQPPLTTAEIATLTANATPLVGQAFAFYTHVQVAAPTAEDTALNNLTGLSHETIAAIYAGSWSDWNQVPKNDGSNTTVTSGSLPIVACRREAGSGTQVAASIFLHNTNCGGADSFVTTAAPGNLATVIENTATGTMRTCITNNKGAIGFISSEADAAGRKQIQIDGQGTLATETANNLGVAAASGDYKFVYELVAIKKSGLAGLPLVLANKLISIGQAQTTGPTTPNVVFLPVGVNAGNAVFPLTTPAGKQPVSCFTRSGNSCAILSDAC